MKKTYNFNPFSGVLDHEIEHTIVPRFPISEIVSHIETNQSIAIEFIGKQGRGKTTHLVWLQQQLPEYPIFHLNNEINKMTEMLQHHSEVVFVDSIHHLSFSERVTLFRKKRVVIYTTHYTRKLSCVLARKKMKIVRFKGITVETLQKIINNRLSFAHSNPQEKIIGVSGEELQKIIKEYGDNYRGIINKLYENYQ